jgi:hypothetical protein
MCIILPNEDLECHVRYLDCKLPVLSASSLVMDARLVHNVYLRITWGNWQDLHRPQPHRSQGEPMVKHAHA